jgi:hypothetical protein
MGTEKRLDGSERILLFDEKRLEELTIFFIAHIPEDAARVDLK